MVQLLVFHQNIVDFLWEVVEVVLWDYFIQTVQTGNLWQISHPCRILLQLVFTEIIPFFEIGFDALKIAIDFLVSLLWLVIIYGADLANMHEPFVLRKLELFFYIVQKL